MNVDQLTDLRAKVDARLLEHRWKIEKQLDRLAKVGVEHSTFREGRRGGVLRRGSVLKGVKVAPKYKGPGGETWAGRGARPRWLAAAMKGGKKLEFSNRQIGGEGAEAIEGIGLLDRAGGKGSRRGGQATDGSSRRLRAVTMRRSNHHL